jgi:hypothetical protein
MRPSDRISLWQFDSACQFLGAARGEACPKLVGKLQGPAGGTELSGAVRAAIAGGAKDLLVLTDGQTWAHIVDELKGEAVRISAILVGAGSLDANVGHLCAVTGGQVFYAPGQDVSSPLKSALEALRTPGAAVVGRADDNGPDTVTALRGGITIEANWSTDDNSQEARATDAIGRFAAALAIPLLDAKAGEAWARAHSLCTHATSLVLVDEAGEATEGFSQMRKVANMAIASGAVSYQQHSPLFSGIRASVSQYEEASFAVSRSSTQCPPSPEVLARLRAAVTDPRKERGAKTPSHQPPNNGLIARLMTRLRTRDRDPVELTFQGFEWDRYCDALLTGDLSSLNDKQAAQHQHIVDDLKHSAANLPKTSHSEHELEIFALGLIARKSGERLAARFARRALAGAPNWVLAQHV